MSEPLWPDDLLKTATDERIPPGHILIGPDAYGLFDLVELATNKRVVHPSPVQEVTAERGK